MSDDNERLVIRRLRKSIGCPVRWEEHILNEWLCKDLRLYWVRLATNYETDGEMTYYSRRHVEWTLYEPTLKAIEHNSSIWREKAVAEYIDKTKFLFAIRFASLGQYSKHYAHPSWSRGEIIKRTAGANALFFHEFDTGELNYCLWWSIHQRLLQAIELRMSPLILQHTEEVGASMGTPTRLIRFDLDYNTPIAHGHPILERELPVNADVISDPQYIFPDEEFLEYDHDIDEPDDTRLTPRRDDPMP